MTPPEASRCARRLHGRSARAFPWSSAGLRASLGLLVAILCPAALGGRSLRGARRRPGEPLLARRLGREPWPLRSTAPLGRPVRPSCEARPGGKNGPRAAYPLCDGVCLALGRARTPCSPLGGDPQLMKSLSARPGRPLSYGARRGRVPLFARRRVDASGRLLPRRGGRGTSLLRLLEPRRRRADGRDGRLQDVPVGDD